MGIKKGDRPGYPQTIPLKMGTKTGKGTPTALEVPLPVIFSTFNRGGYLPSGQGLPYIKPSNYRLVFTLYPVKRFFGSPQLAGTIACVTTRRLELDKGKAESNNRSAWSPEYSIVQSLAPICDTLALVKSCKRFSTLSLYTSLKFWKTLRKNQTFLGDFISLASLPVKILSFSYGKRIPRILLIGNLDKLVGIAL